MSTVWYILVTASLLIISIFHPSGFMIAVNESAKKAISLSLNLCGIYLIWMGIFKIAEKAKITDAMAKPLRPIIKFLFGDISKDSEKYLLENVTANMIGIGGASTVSGIKAAESMSQNSEILTYSGLMLIVLNACSVQLFPTTIISLRESCGSLNASDIFFPSLIATICTTLIGIVLVKIYWKFHKKHEAKKNRKKLV